MNREIKFRAWDKRMSRMLSDATPMRGSIWWNDGACFDSCGKEYDVMQFTGLLDKDGKEIYEGDYVAHVNGNTYTVQWNQLHCGWGLYLNGSMQKELGANWITNKGDVPERWEAVHLEVVGHIYEPLR